MNIVPISILYEENSIGNKANKKGFNCMDMQRCLTMELIVHLNHLCGYIEDIYASRP